MRIMLALGWYFPDSLGGTEVYVRGLARALREAGHDVQIVAPRAGAAVTTCYEHDAVRVLRYPVPVQPTRAEAQGDVPARGASYLHHYVADWEPQIFHAHSLVTGLGLHELAAAKRAGAQVVYTNHLPSMGFICSRGTLLRDGVIPCDGIQDEIRCGACLLQQRDVPDTAARGLASLPGALSRTLSSIPGPAGTALGIRNLVRKAAVKHHQLLEISDRIVVLNAWAARIFEQNGAGGAKIAINRLGITHPGLTAKPSAPATPTSKPITVGYIGRFDEIKGLHVLAEAMGLLNPDVSLKLVVAGPSDGPHAQSVLGQFRNAIGSDHRVTISPAIDPAAVGETLRSLDLLVCPSLCFESGPTIALEAMAVGTPVLGTRLGAFVEIIKDAVNGRLVEPGDPVALAAALREVAERPSESIDRWRAGLTPVRTMDDIAADYLELYGNLLGRALSTP